MALNPTDFIAPKGELTPTLFPDTDDLSSYVTAWLTEATGKAPDDEEAQRHWVYYRAYDHVANRLSAEPAQADQEGEGSVQYLAGQIQHFRDKAALHRADYKRLTEVDPNKGGFRVRRPRRPGEAYVGEYRGDRAGLTQRY